MTQYTMISHYATDLQVAVMHKDKQQCTDKGKEEGNKLVNMDINYAEFKILLFPWKKNSTGHL